MRLFLLGWANTVPELVDVMLELQKKLHKIVYWVKDFETLKVNKSLFPDAIFHDHYDALAGLPAPGIDDSDFAPPGKELLEKLYETESIVLTMMNKKYSRFSLGERKHFYYHLLRYWDNVIKKVKPNIIIIPEIPHTVYDFVIYSLAKLYKIKTIIFHPAAISDRWTAMDDYIEGNIKIKNAADADEKSFSLADISSDIVAYYNEERDPKIDPTPPCVRTIWRNYSGANLFFIKIRAVYDSIKNGSIFSKIFRHILKYFKLTPLKEYASVQQDPNFNKKFIYVPLHYQPEQSTSPEGGFFVDQILMIETLTSAIPSDWLIYVKEHPTQWLPMGDNYFNYRYRGYYKHIASIKNVKIIPIKTASRPLINSAQAVATVAGTSAIEAIFRSKPTLVFGHAWYKDWPGIFKINDVQSCRLAIETIKNGFRVNQEQIKKYLYYLDKFSFHGYFDEWTKMLSKITAQENYTNFLNALKAEIEK